MPSQPASQPPSPGSPRRAQQRDAAVAFIEAINAHDVEHIVALLAADYEFVNSQGDRFQGEAFMRETWADQFNKHPDFRIRVGRLVADEEAVAIFGFSEGTYAPDGQLRVENRWSVPAAFLLMSREGKVSYFESFSDASMVYDLIQAATSQSATADDE
jgi:predicted ester cyclase